VAVWQLVEIGMSATAARSRVRAWRWQRIHRGVYAVGWGPLTPMARAMAAVLACGPEAVLSHHSAAALLGIRSDARTKHDVTVPGRRRSRPGIEIHSGRLEPQDTTAVEGIPCTSVARTLLDLAESVDARALDRAVEQAERNRIFDLDAIDDVLARADGRRGAPRLRRAVEGHRETGARSELEHRFLELCEAAGLPRPETNVWLEEGLEVDFLWREQGLAVETDGYAIHGTRQAFERDRHRDQRLLGAGLRVMRVTWRQLEREPEAVVERVRSAVYRRAA
jgi:Protein of unknown function (DUF559)